MKFILIAMLICMFAVYNSDAGLLDGLLAPITGLLGKKK